MIEEVERNGVGRAGEARASVAAQLCEERRKQGLSLGDVAEALRIRESYVGAIEEERFHELPGPAYAHGFVGSYAELLDLDRRAVLARFRKEIAGGSAENELKFLVPLKNGRFPGRAILATSVALAIAVWGGWYAYAKLEKGKPPAPQLAATKPVSELKTPSPAGKAEISALLRHLSATAGPLANTQPAAADKGRADAARNPIKVRPVGARPIEARKKPKRTGPRKTKPAAAANPASGKARIVLKALHDTWVRIRMADGTKVFSRILKAGDRYSVLKNRGMVLTAGNAGGLRIIVDGRTLPPLGPRGAIRKGIRLDADALLASR